MMEYKGYIAKVEFDPDARILHGEVIGIRDVVTFQGDSVEEVEQAFHESVDDYLAFCKQRGEAPDKPYSGQFVVRLDPELHRRISMAAQVKGTSLNALVAETLGEAVPEPLSPSAAKAAAGKPVAPKHRKRRTFKQTAEEMILGLLKGKALTTSELEAAWKKAGRGDKVDHTLGKLGKVVRSRR